MWVWLAYETGVLDALTAFSAAWQEEHPVGTEPPPLAEPFAHPMEWLRWMTTCYPRLPRDPQTLLRLAQDVIVALLMTKIFYYTLLTVSLQMQLKSLAAYERLEGGSAAVEEGMLTQERQLDAMRSQLLAYIRSNAQLKAKVERDGALRESVEQQRLYVSGFLAEMMHAHTELISEFSPHTWFLMELYAAFTAGTLYMCVGYVHLTLFVDVVFYGGSLYILYRLLLHRFLLRQSARDLGLETRRPPRPRGARRARCAPAGRRVGRLAPLPAGRPRHHRLRAHVTQAVGARRAALPAGDALAAPLPARALRDRPLPPRRRRPLCGGRPPRPLVPKVVALLVWALPPPRDAPPPLAPPFLDELEHSLLLHTLRKFPSGLPADARLVPATNGAAMARAAAAASASAAAAREPPPRAAAAGAAAAAAVAAGDIRKTPSMSGGLSYVVMKAAQSEESWVPTRRAMRTCWRWLVGLPPLRNPGQRLAEHERIQQQGGGGAIAADDDAELATMTACRSRRHSPTCARGRSRPRAATIPVARRAAALQARRCCECESPRSRRACAACPSARSTAASGPRHLLARAPPLRRHAPD